MIFKIESWLKEREVAKSKGGDTDRSRAAHRVGVERRKRHIFDYLLKSKGATANEIAEHMKMHPASIRVHLNRLLSEGCLVLCDRVKEGQLFKVKDKRL